MEQLTQSEKQQIESIGELEGNKLFEATSEQQDVWFALDDFDPLSDTKDEWAGVELSAELKECALRFESLACEWSLPTPEGEVTGEFSLPHLYLALIDAAPQHSDVASDRDRLLLGELRMIDSAPSRATGEASFIRIERHKKTLEIWHQDRYLHEEKNNTQGFLEMDLSYCEYLNTLRMTKGAFGWQLLFLDIPLHGDAFRPHVENLKGMLRVFPSEFQQYDYTPLMSRLEARL
ncbi:hypothetical protein ACIGJO_18475 [Streptomyces sp. NPDC079020]|uniref:hypothetical protein n=1 Tax=Streptomyces sp. NPDC079020 TaxID=3365722 RepID=UPI0037CE8ECC